MKDSGFNTDILLKLISGVLEGGLDDADRTTLNTLLKEKPEARRIYRGHMELHTRLHLDYTETQLPAHMPGAAERPPKTRFPVRWTIAAAMAASIAILATFLWQRPQEPGPFATLENVRGARWDSGDLSTAQGSRIGRGTLRLSEGLATIRFDSGAELTIEAPAEVHLSDAMLCTLTKGTAVANVPESAIGFRIVTPSAEVVDYGTRFAVAVDPASGRTRTQVYEGLVKVENRTSGVITSLYGGQDGIVEGDSVEIETIGPPARSADWIVLENHKDAYIGRAYLQKAGSPPVETHRSDTLLLVKNGTVHRKAYLGYDLAHIDPDRIAEAELMLHFAPTGWGVASVVPDATFSVYGLLTDKPWDESSLNEREAPANKTRRAKTWLEENKARKLGSFQVGQGVQSGIFGISGDTLATYLREHAGSTITLIVVRDTPELETNGLVHGFASRRHPVLRPPTLAIRLSEP